MRGLLNDAMTLTPIHPDGMRLLRHYEGLCLKAYTCPAGVWTIGYGHTEGVKRGDRITQAQAEEILRADLQIFVNGVRAAIKGTPLNAYRFSALVCLAFNIGLESFRRSTVLKMVLAGRFEDVPDAMRLWNKVKGKVSPGLVNRREAEIALWNTKWEGDKG